MLVLIQYFREHGATIKILYKFTIKNTGEKDYIDENEINFIKQNIKETITNIYADISNIKTLLVISADN